MKSYRSEKHEPLKQRITAINKFYSFNTFCILGFNSRDIFYHVTKIIIKNVSPSAEAIFNDDLFEHIYLVQYV